MNILQSLVGLRINKEDICLADNAITHTILKDKKYFSYLVMKEANVNNISSSTKLIEGFGRVNISLPGGTKLTIDEALFCNKS